MKRLMFFFLVLLLAGLFVGHSFADQEAEDKAVMDEVMAKVDAGEMTVEQALATAVEKGVSFTVIVETCQTLGIPLNVVITAAASVGVTSEVTLAKMADAGVSKEQMSAAITQATGQPDPGLGYTQQQPTTKITPVAPVTSNPGGTAETGTVSPSTL